MRREQPNGVKPYAKSAESRLRPKTQWQTELRLHLQNLEARIKYSNAYNKLIETSKIRQDRVKKLQRKPWKSQMSEDMRDQASEYLEIKGDDLVDKFNIKISDRDLHTLTSGQWLNDEVINFYAALINDRAKSGPKYPKVYMHNTHFYSTLSSSGYDKVRRWTKRAKVDVFSLDYMIVPIHLGMHWTCAVVDFTDQKIDYYDSLLGSHDCFSILREYLQKESLDKKGVEFDLSKWQDRRLEDIPRQENGYDCGVFACQIAEHVSRKGELSYTQANMPELRLQMIWEIVNEELISRL